MSQHFLLTAAARTVSLKQILRMEEAEAWTLFCTIRWPESDGVPVCPQCGCPTCWACPRPNGAPRFRCSACRRDFSPTSGTLFAFHKLEIRDYLAAVVIFCDEVKGKAALAQGNRVKPIRSFLRTAVALWIMFARRSVLLSKSRLKNRST